MMFIFLITFIIMKCVTSLPVMLFQLLSTSGNVYIAHLRFLIIKCIV